MCYSQIIHFSLKSLHLFLSKKLYIVAAHVLPISSINRGTAVKIRKFLSHSLLFQDRQSGKQLSDKLQERLSGLSLKEAPRERSTTLTRHSISGPVVNPPPPPPVSLFLLLLIEVSNAKTYPL